MRIRNSGKNHNILALINVTYLKSYYVVQISIHMYVCTYVAIEISRTIIRYKVKKWFTDI